MASTTFLIDAHDADRVQSSRSGAQFILDRWRAFTVPEMLAVIAVIVIIVSVLLPNLQKSRETARRAICMSNQHQQGILYRAFASEYRGRVPLQYTVPTARRHSMFYKNNSRWYNFGKLFEAGFLKDVGMVKCPSFKGGSAWPTEIVGFGTDIETLEQIVAPQNRVLYLTYNVRPVVVVDAGHNLLPVDDHLTRLADVAGKAITSDSFYLMYGAAGDPIHNFEGVVAGYGDGSGQWVKADDTIIPIARTDRSSSAYWNVDPNPTPPSLWGYLDERR